MPEAEPTHSQSAVHRSRPTRERPKPLPTKSRMASSVDAATPLLTPKQAAAYLGLSIWTLARMRARGVGPDYASYCRRFFYDVSALDAFVAKNLRRPTADGR